MDVRVAVDEVDDSEGEAMAVDVPSDSADDNKGQGETDDPVSNANVSSEECAPPRKRAKRTKVGGIRASIRTHQEKERAEKDVEESEKGSQRFDDGFDQWENDKPMVS